MKKYLFIVLLVGVGFGAKNKISKLSNYELQNIEFELDRKSILRFKNKTNYNISYFSYIIVKNDDLLTMNSYEADEYRKKINETLTTDIFLTMYKVHMKAFKKSDEIFYFEIKNISFNNNGSFTHYDNIPLNKKNIVTVRLVEARGSKNSNQKSLDIDEILKISTSKVSETMLPKFLDKNTRWDSNYSIPGRKIFYTYTLVNYDASHYTKSQINKVKKKLKDRIKNNWKSIKLADLYRKYQVRETFTYYDKKGIKMFDIVLVGGE
jgi:hypothetical protein